MDKEKFIHTLPNGLRIAINHTPGNVAYAGLIINAGSRDEAPDHYGLAHFVEHTVFKGTRNRSSWHISNRMEAIGGELNAYTFKEGTTIYTIAPSGYEARTLELLTDLVNNSTFPTHEIDKEREVIIEEINAYLDTPSDAVYDQFEELIYAGSPLSHNILGTPETVRSIKSDDCRAFVDRFYSPGNMAAFISTPTNPEKIVRLLEKHFGSFNRPDRPPVRQTPALAPKFDIVRDNNGHQAHTIIGARIFDRNDPRRFPLLLLNNYLGGPGMNSRLNQALREKRGLVYTADSFVSLLSDSGLLIIYFGSDRDAVGRCCRIVRNELDRMAQKTLSPRVFNKIKEQYCGQMLVSSDNKESMAMSLGRNLLFYNRLTDISATARRVREVTAEQFREVAELLCEDNCSRLTLM